MGAVQSPEYRASMGVRAAISGLEALMSLQGQQLGQPCDLHVQHPVAAAPETYNPIPRAETPHRTSRVSVQTTVQNLGRQHRKANWW